MKTSALKTVTLLVLIITCIGANAQNRFQLSSSTVTFFSSAPLENIEASNKKAKGILDVTTNTFLVKVPIKGFDFSSDLMEDHFNENYLESDKYPEAVFRGTLQGSYDLTRNGNYPVTASGDFTMHGVTQKKTISCNLAVNNGIPSITSAFNITIADYKIDIPTLVFQKIAEVVEVKIEGTLAKM